MPKRRHKQRNLVPLSEALVLCQLFGISTVAPTSAKLCRDGCRASHVKRGDRNGTVSETLPMQSALPSGMFGRNDTMRNLLLFIISCVITFNLSAQKTTAIKCGAVLDVRTGQLNKNVTIVVKNNKIESISPAGAMAKIKADTIIDLSAYTILPGLIDCHTHVLLQGDITSEDYDVQLLKESIPYRTIRAVRSCSIALQNGFTTIRDLGTEGAGYADVDLKKAIKNGEMPGPRMFVSTLAINTTGHYPISGGSLKFEANFPPKTLN